MDLEVNAKAIANPTKAFFVRMITRDISLEDCILDLIDNSIDEAWKSEGSKPVGLAEGASLEKYSIQIFASPDTFKIRDNCGGMKIEDARKHAFNFGRQADDPTDDYSIGVYGIGMKRAIFKLGNDALIASTYTDDAGDTNSFSVPIKVDDWLKNDVPPWDFDIKEGKKLDAPGVEITVTSLSAAAKSAFDNPSFLQNLKRTISRDYSLHLARGLSVFVNDQKIEGWKIELRQSDEFTPMRTEYQDVAVGEKVTVELIAGMAAPPPDDVEPAEDEEGDKRFGWYVVCNGRIVLAADKTSLSGWGTDGWPQWHRQYSGFMGIILFTSISAEALPLTTTKRSVDVSSEVFRRAKPKMREVTRQWIDYTNARKQALEQAKDREASATSVALQQVARQESVRLPSYVAKPKERVANINYSVPLIRLNKLRTSLGNVNMAYRDVGIKSFDYMFDDYVGDD